MNKHIGIRVDDFLYDTVDKLAYFEYKSMSEIARELMILGIAHLTEKELKQGRGV